jgi:hypothetical protein
VSVRGKSAGGAKEELVLEAGKGLRLLGAEGVDVRFEVGE